MTVSRRKTKPIDATKPTPPEYRLTLHIAMNRIELADLDKIAGDLKRGPLGRLHINIGREKAARHAIGEYAKTLPPAGDTTD
jgi:hypothetical protein